MVMCFDRAVCSVTEGEDPELRVAAEGSPNVTQSFRISEILSGGQTCQVNFA